MSTLQVVQYIQAGQAVALVGVLLVLVYAVKLLHEIKDKE
jgi:hypothetical protein